MSERQNMHRIPDLAYEEAGEWFVLHREDALDAADRERFDAWLRCSPQNVQAYLEVSATWEDVPRLDPAWNPGAEGLIALDRRQANVIPLDKAVVPSRPVSQRNGRVPRWAAYAASVVIAGVLIGYGMYAHRPLTYSTGIGEQRFIALPDGSRLKLNALSRVRLRFNDRERRVELLEGQGLFAVAKDRRRPFVVSAGVTRVQAVGTQFDVYRKMSGTVVTVIEGRVVVGDRGGAPERSGSVPAGAPVQPEGVFLNAGQQLTVDHSAAERAEALAPEQVVSADIGVTTAWTQQRLVFQSSPLREVVEEFNRYNARPLSIADARLEDYRISGVFASTDPDPLLRFLRTQKSILVTESEAGIRISRQ